MKEHEIKQIAGIASNQLASGTLSVRKTRIYVPEDAAEVDVNMYYNGQIIVVEGQPTYSDAPPKKHFCVLLNSPEDLNVPDILSHEVTELYFSDISETRIPEDRTLTANTPIDGNIQGYAFINKVTAEIKNVPPVATSNLSEKSYPEVNPTETKVTGNKKGAIVTDAKGDFHVITGDGTTVKFGEKIELADKKTEGTADGGTNTFIINNPVNTGELFGFSLPGLLPLFIAVEKVPNIPKITNTYLEVKRYKDILVGIKNIIDTMVPSA